VIEKAELCSLIPHQGEMCLLDQVIQWDAESIICQSNSHLNKNNPLRKSGKLSAIHLIEYGAQAAAVHGGLSDREKGAAVWQAYIAAVRQVELGVSWLDEVVSPLKINATKLMGDESSVIYSFDIHASDDLLGKGRVTIVGVQNQEE